MTQSLLKCYYNAKELPLEIQILLKLLDKISGIKIVKVSNDYQILLTLAFIFHVIILEFGLRQSLISNQVLNII